jgi:hypothetical protein
MSIIDDAILQLQTHALELTSENIKSAPSYPVETAASMPLVITYISEGTAEAVEATTVKMLYTINVDFHVNRTSMKSAYTQINNIIPEYIQRLAGDPTLGDTVDTINFPISFTVGPAQWDTMVTQMASLSIPVKFRESPTT